MKLSQFDFNLPDELIALYPAENRDEARLMVLHRKTNEIEHKLFKDIKDYFKEKDLMIFNDTKVFPARLYGTKEKTGAQIEVFLLRELNKEQRLWDVLVDPARKIRIGNKLYFGENDELVAAFLALHLYSSEEIHDEESNVLTIDRIQRRYSPWSSKIYSMNNPQR